MHNGLLVLDSAGLKSVSDGHKRKAKSQIEPVFRLLALVRFRLHKGNGLTSLIKVHEIHKSIYIVFDVQADNVAQSM